MNRLTQGSAVEGTADGCRDRLIRPVSQANRQPIGLAAWQAAGA